MGRNSFFFSFFFSGFFSCFFSGFFSCLHLSSSLASAPLKLQDVLTESLKTFPKVQQKNYELSAKKEAIVSSLGAFDLKLKGKADYRAEGFYSGRSYTASLEKPLYYWGSSLYLGHRLSAGEYPNYEQKALTNSGGEYRAGIKFSLLQDRAIDPARGEFLGAELDFKQSEEFLFLTKLKVQKAATTAYYSWLVSGKIYDVYRELLEIAKKRNSGIVSRVKGGDLAEIYITENRQYILKRTISLREAERDFRAAALELNLYYPIASPGELGPGAMAHQQIPIKALPRDFEKLDFDSIFSRLAAERPELKALRYEIEKISLAEDLGDNKVLPRLDIHMEGSKDYGGERRSLDPAEARVFLTLEVPIERREGLGKRNKARMEQEALKEELNLLNATLKARLGVVLERLRAARSLYKNAGEEVSVAKKLELAEIAKFNRGASDFFVVNLREQNRSDAQVKKFKAYLDYQKSLAEYKDLTQTIKE